MPKKGKKSQAAKARWQKLDVSQCAIPTERAEILGPQSSRAEVNLSQPPNADVTCVLASHSQDSEKYGQFSRNKQCTCNSLTFLAFLHENPQLTRADLDLVLDKGDEMYRFVRNQMYQQRRQAFSFLATDELPETATARRQEYNVEKCLSKYGEFTAPVPVGADDYLNLAERLQCLSSEVNNALLIMAGLCIAVFRTRAGRYGFFDPHSRRPDGLPCPPHGTGTAVMLTFTHLSDLIRRLHQCYSVLNICPSCQYELMPVLFHVDQPVLDESFQCTHANAHNVVSPMREQEVHMSNVTQPETEMSIPSCTATPHARSPAANVMMTHVNSSEGTVERPSSEIPQLNRQHMPVLSKYTKQQRRKFKRAMLLQKTKPTNDKKKKKIQRRDAQKTKERKKYAEDKLYKQRKRSYADHRYSHNADFKQRQMSYVTSRYRQDSEFKQRQMSYVTSRYSQDAEFKQRQMSYVTSRYSQDAEFKQRQMSYVTSRYSQDAEFKQRQMSYVTSRYSQDAEFKQRQMSYVTSRYSQDAEFKQRQMLYVTSRYSQDAEFKQRQMSYVTSRYSQDVEFKQRQMSYVTSRYSQDAEFKQRQMSYVTSRYSQDVEFKQRQMSYVTSRYSQDAAFRLRQKLYITRRYANEPEFRLKQKQKMKQHMQNKYRNNVAFRITHNMQCAMKIKRKYRRINRQDKQVPQSDNPLIKKAISVFQSQIKNSPTYICTVCHRALFPNQVRPCIRSNYVKKPDVVETCLTGKFVHVCDDECQQLQQCRVPNERRKEWICYTCHDYVKNGSMPSLAVANNLELAQIPPELSDLNILERHLIAKYIAFAKIIPLPKGQQRAIRGNVVCVPSEVEETVNALPRLTSESQVMRVKLKRRLCYKGHQMFQTVTWCKLVRALHKLKEIHPQYEDITVRDEAELCDPTLHNEEDDSDVDENMEDDDYDEDDLMDIDRCERSAMCEAQNDHDNEQPSIQIPPCEEQSDDTEQDGDQPNDGIALESCLQPVDVSEEILSFSEGIYCVAPAEGQQPVSFFRTPKLEAMAFPVQFPTGENTLDDNRHKKLTPISYFKSRLLCVDDRFARDTNYLFFAQFVSEIHSATSSMRIQLRKGRPVTRDGRRITSSMLRDKREVEKLVRNKDAVRFMQPLRGTPAYWEKTTRDLFAMIRQLGSPTFFCTFSAAEMRWPEVIEAIKTQQGEQVNLEELDWATKCEILRSNPVTTMRMFEKRVDALFRDLILSPAQPLGKVVDYFYRLEFQHRGSPHIHCLIWVEGAPVFDEDSDETVCNFICQYITAQLPDPNTQPELYRKVTEVQMHSKNHSKSCHKNNRSACRFGFPKPPAKETTITRPGEHTDTAVLTAAKRKLRPLTELLSDPTTASLNLPQLLAKCNLSYEEYERSLHALTNASVVIMKRDPKDCWVNGYNPHLLDAWDANIDIQYILNPYSCIMYITSYITKAEHGMSDYLKTLIQHSNQDNVNECEEMMQIMQAYSKKREVSAQECVTRACSINMKKCSRSVIFVPTDDSAVKMSHPISYLESTMPDSDNVWMTGLTEKYKARPETLEFEKMCLADFASTCRIVYGKQTNGKGVLPLLNELGFVQRRTNGKPAVIRYHRFSPEKNPEEFCGTLLKLYLPYRSEAQLKSQWFPTYQSFYTNACVQLPGSDHIQSVYEIVKDKRHEYEQHSKEIESAIEEFEKNGPIRDEWCNLAPESEVVRLECIAELEAGPSDNQNEQEDVPEYRVQSEARTGRVLMIEAPPVDSAVIRQMYQSLNQKQASIFYTVRDWCIKRVCGLNPDQFFYYINGGAGTGKSHLIKCIHSEASKILCAWRRRCDDTDISKPTVLLTAFTGTAAFNISGKTLHSMLKLPRSLKPPFQGLGNALDEVRAEISNAEIIVIDEVSMVSKPLFAYVDMRLKQIKGIQRPFGGMSVLAVGDFYQLPPLGQAKPLCVYEPCQIDLWRDHFQMITLTKIMRQKDDVAFAEMLNRIRVKQKRDALSEADSALLSQAITEPALCPTDVLHIFATNKQVDEHNSTTLALLHSHITNIDADDFRKDPRTGRMARQAKPCQGTKQELPDKLQVAEGARVMLTRNIDVEDGLVNGSFGKIVRIVPCEKDATHVKMLGVELDNENAGRIQRNKAPGGSDNVVYIERVEENLRQKGVVRRQFPMKLAFACTTHKVQGMTTSSAVVSLKNIFVHGMAYVALSRVTSLSGMHIVDMDEKKIYANPEITAALESMRQASFDDIMPLLQITQTSNRPDTLTIIHHNTEGLPAHVSDIKSHHELCLADVLCLTETKLRGSFVADSLHLEGYNMFKRNRHLSYTNFPQLANSDGGGVAIYVKRHLHVREKQYIQNVTDLEFVLIKVEAPMNALIAAVYRPPDYSVGSFLSNLERLLETLEIMDHHPVIVCGDFNEDQLPNTRKPILELFQSRGYTQLITTATTEKHTLLDLIFISRPQHRLHSGVLQTYHSYHLPVYCVLTDDIFCEAH